jgi:hypothetical protein
MSDNSVPQTDPQNQDPRTDPLTPDERSIYAEAYNYGRNGCTYPTDSRRIFALLAIINRLTAPSQEPQCGHCHSLAVVPDITPGWQFCHFCGYTTQILAAAPAPDAPYPDHYDPAAMIRAIDTIADDVADDPELSRQLQGMRALASLDAPDTAHYTTLDEAIQASNEQTKAEYAAQGYDAKLLAMTILSGNDAPDTATAPAPEAAKSIPKPPFSGECVCPNCGEWTPRSADVCQECGFSFLDHPGKSSDAPEADNEDDSGPRQDWQRSIYKAADEEDRRENNPNEAPAATAAKSVRLTKLQRELLQKVCDKADKDDWYLDKSSREYRCLTRLCARGLVDGTGEGEGLWRCYWDITDAGRKALKAVQS